MISRRSLLLAAPFWLSAGSRADASEAEDGLPAIERRHGGRLGAFAFDTASRRTLSHRADERFLMCSTFKGLLAALTLRNIDLGHESLARLVRYDEGDLRAAGYPDFACPVTAANVGRGALTIGTLCKAIVEVSDNLGAILLMRGIGGPPGLTGFLRELGDDITRSDRYEPSSNDYDGVLDTTTPRAIVATVWKTILGNILSRESRGLLQSWMIDSPAGRKRLRASCPPDWIVGDKTGTSAAEETNDYAIARPPGRPPLLIAAYYDAPRLDLNVRESVLREVGAVFAR